MCLPGIDEAATHHDFLTTTMMMMMMTRWMVTPVAVGAWVVMDLAVMVTTARSVCMCVCAVYGTLVTRWRGTVCAAW